MSKLATAPPTRVEITQPLQMCFMCKRMIPENKMWVNNSRSQFNCIEDTECNRIRSELSKSQKQKDDEALDILVRKEIDLYIARFAGFIQGGCGEESEYMEEVERAAKAREDGFIEYKDVMRPYFECKYKLAYDDLVKSDSQFRDGTARYTHTPTNRNFRTRRVRIPPYPNQTTQSKMMYVWEEQY